MQEIGIFKPIVFSIFMQFFKKGWNKSTFLLVQLTHATSGAPRTILEKTKDSVNTFKYLILIFCLIAIYCVFIISCNLMALQIFQSEDLGREVKCLFQQMEMPTFREIHEFIRITQWWNQMWFIPDFRHQYQRPFVEWDLFRSFL